MKKLLALGLVVGATATTLSGCSGEKEAKLPQMPNEVVTLADEKIVDYIGFEEATYIDLRNQKDMAGGYVEGFKNISFFNFLHLDQADAPENWNDSGAMVAYDRSAQETVADAHVNENFAVTQYFGAKDKQLFLMCQSGGRASWVETILVTHFGYKDENVHNIGGWSDAQKNTKLSDHLVTA